MSKRLGKGLQALFNEHEEEKESRIEELPLTELRPNPYQPRKTFSDQAIEELAVSIKENGILQPITVRKSIKGYEIVVGERRFRAAEAAGLNKIPVIVKELSEEKMMELALIENLQREDLNPIEEALAYERLMEHLKVTQEQLSKRVGKSRPHIANHVRLLQLPQVVQQFISDGKLSMGHGRAILGLKDKQKISSLLEVVLQEKLSVREVEQMVQRMNENVSRETKKKKQTLSPFLKERQDLLKARFGTSVTIKPGKKKGKIEIDYFSEEDLERILQLMDNADEQESM
ncbi:plasmid partitioning protein ParB [Alkalihalobacillus alcalophilus ATCC 27647 = CGMCC 1.3604]|uniref:Plasmid partitioning protein ParB n=1 Tax=Alkalihalobacillus alcalophilus ATCC 27647 = CGMCC 1.3604 TaxID=1218173 RepID=A0A4S4JXJ0_ALKAL|nr:ParB/RepB/Spo0J family partition protein [Alkalihalobacillus alcalophilus]MED1560346.1 ParB/RepB/Spo0J family partition protein [Alkalihalobacillus alcalophilus]THG89953.1 plasmid partitioning protein ParB [Alkalihalobacillus alcalophilus ATCC 27647 = CGMCC 1.3604]